MKSVAYTMGFLCGIGLVAIVSLILYFIRKKKKTGDQYDERQQLIQGKAYKTAFWVLMTYLMLNGMFQLGTGIEWSDLMTSSIIGICLSLTVYAITCIKNDAYFPINKKPLFYYILFGAIIVANIALGVFNMLDSSTQFITNGRLNFHILNFFVAAMLLVVLAALSVKQLSGKIPEGRRNS